MVVAAPPGDWSIVGAEHEDVCRMREQQSVLLVECSLGTFVETLVRIADAAREREVARDRPDREQCDQAEQAKDDDAPPPRTSRQLEPDRPEPAEAGPCTAARSRASSRPLRARARACRSRRLLPLHASALVDAIGLLVRGHAAK